MTCFRRCLTVFIILVTLAGGTAVVALGFAATWLVRNDPPVKVDVIISLSGDPRRPLDAADLYHAGYAKQIILTAEARWPGFEALDQVGVPFPRMADVYRDVLLKRGVPASAIQLVGKDVISTAAEAEAIQAVLPADATVMVVTSPYHTRRTGMIFGDALGSERVHVVASTHEPFPARWWTQQDAARNVLLESAKIVYYMLGGRFRK